MSQTTLKSPKPKESLGTKTNWNPLFGLFIDALKIYLTKKHFFWHFSVPSLFISFLHILVQKFS